MQKLNAFKQKIDREIEKCLDKAILETRKKDRLMGEALSYVKKMVLAQGKRIRPALMYYGYLAAGGKEEKRIIKTSASIELIHIFLLIHDDIIDKSDKRHGIDTVHVEFESASQKLFPHKDSKHFGSSMAIIIGDMICALGNQIIAESGFNLSLVNKALAKLQTIISLTVIGEAKDILIEHAGKATEREVMEMYELKTARYTFEGPLHLGVILGGGDAKLLKALTAYAVPLGIAFQIQDDILGIFGSEAKMGKSASSDIAEGKQTILVAKVLKEGTARQKEKLLGILGKKNLSAQEIKEFQSIVKETGSLEYAREMARRLTLQGQKAAEKLKVPLRAKEFLQELAELMLSREV